MFCKECFGRKGQFEIVCEKPCRYRCFCRKQPTDQSGRHDQA